jgi:hypothetical protein
MSPALKPSCPTGRPMPGSRGQRRRTEDPTADPTAAAAEIRRAMVELGEVCRRLEAAIRLLRDRKGRAAWLRSAAECTARDFLPRAIRALRGGLACRPAGDP